MQFKLPNIWKKKTIKDLLPPPVRASHGEYSMILSAQDDPSRPTPELIRIAMSAIDAANKTDLSFLKNDFANLWPGEHYKLLAGFVEVLQPEVVIEIGTSTGLSALSMLPFFSGRLITFDIQRWDSYPDTVLQKEDFGRLAQIVDNLGSSAVFEKHRALLEEAEFIFIDATHDGKLESALLKGLSTLKFKKSPILFFDDIRVWTMLEMWRNIPFPKLDLTSFGHWSGSGIVSFTSS